MRTWNNTQLMIGIVVLVLSAYASRAGDEKKRATAAIEKAGATITPNSIECDPKTDMTVVLKEIHNIPNISAVSLNKIGTDEHLKGFEVLPLIRSLELRGSFVTDKGMKSVAAHKN
jgi:hypothetical protein